MVLSLIRIVFFACGVASWRCSIGVLIDEHHQDRVRIALAGGVGHRQSDHANAAHEANDAAAVDGAEGITSVHVRYLGRRSCAPTPARGRPVAEVERPARNVAVRIAAANPSEAEGPGTRRCEGPATPTEEDSAAVIGRDLARARPNGPRARLLADQGVARRAAPGEIVAVLQRLVDRWRLDLEPRCRRAIARHASELLDRRPGLDGRERDLVP